MFESKSVKLEVSCTSIIPLTMYVSIFKLQTCTLRGALVDVEVS